MPETRIKNVCVYCASSDRSLPVYLEAATRLGTHLAESGFNIVYGGGSAGSMGRMADAALKAGAKVTGVSPKFMDELEWTNRSLTELHIVNDMHERKKLMLHLSDAVVALPGGCGTLEELFEAITWKRLGLYFGPVVLVNVNKFYDPCLQLLNSTVEHGFMNAQHAAMWTSVDQPESVAAALAAAPEWPATARSFAAVRA